MTIEHMFRLLSWIEFNYGRTGLLIAFAIVMGVVIGILWLIQLLPIPDNQSLCEYCKYENPNKNSRVYGCSRYTKCRAFQVRAAKCPYIGQED